MKIWWLLKDLPELLEVLGHIKCTFAFLYTAMALYIVVGSLLNNGQRVEAAVMTVLIVVIGPIMGYMFAWLMHAILHCIGSLTLKQGE